MRLWGDPARPSRAAWLRGLLMGIILGFVAGQSGLPADAKSLVGTSRGDILIGTNSTDSMDGRGGHDRMEALGGDDALVGDSGHDTMIGGEGRDAMLGGPGNDTIYGEEESTLPSNGPGYIDFVIAGTGSDVMYLQDGKADYADCGDGFDTVLADAADVLSLCENVIF